MKSTWIDDAGPRSLAVVLDDIGSLADGENVELYSQTEVGSMRFFLADDEVTRMRAVALAKELHAAQLHSIKTRVLTTTVKWEGEVIWSAEVRQ